MKVTVKLTRAEKKRLARLKSQARKTQRQMESAFGQMERAWKRGKAPAKIARAMQVTTARANKSIKAMVSYYGKLKRKFPR